MRIGFLCNEYPPGQHGGIGTITQVLARGLVQAGHSVRVLGVYWGLTALVRHRDEGVDVWRLPHPTGRWGWISARRELHRWVSRWARDGEIDLMEVPDWEGWAAGWPRLPVPVISRWHGCSTYFAHEMGRRAARMTRWIDRQSLRRSDFRCAVSRYTARRTAELFAMDASEVEVLHNPMSSPPLMAARKCVGQRVVFTGTLVPKKGIVPLIQAWPDVVRQCPSAELHVYGKEGKTDDGRPMIETLQQMLGVQGVSVRFHGHVSRGTLFDALATARAAVFPSFAEAFALAPLEAMAVGCPTIYSRLGSGPELIDEGVHGLLIDPNHPREIAESLIRVLTDDRLAERLGTAGARHVRSRFSLEQAILRNVEFYERCVSRFTARGTDRAESADRQLAGAGCS